MKVRSAGGGLNLATSCRRFLLAMSKRKAKVVVNAVEDDDATELSGREAQRIAGLNADHGKLAVGTAFCTKCKTRDFDPKSPAKFSRGASPPDPPNFVNSRMCDHMVADPL